MTKDESFELQIDFSALCRAAREGQVGAIRSCLLNYGDDNIHQSQKSPPYIKHSSIPSKSSRLQTKESLIDSTAPIQALFNFLCRPSFYPDSSRERGEERMEVGRYFSNVHDIITESQHLLAIRSLLILPTYTETPWNMAMRLIEIVLAEEEQFCDDYYLSDDFDLSDEEEMLSNHLSHLGSVQKRLLKYQTELQMFISKIGIWNHYEQTTETNTYHVTLEAQHHKLLSLFHRIIRQIYHCDYSRTHQDERGKSIVVILDLLPDILSAAQRLDIKLSSTQTDYMIDTVSTPFSTSKQSLKPRSKKRPRVLRQNNLFQSNTFDKMLQALYRTSIDNTTDNPTSVSVKSKGVAETSSRPYIHPQLFLAFLQISKDLYYHLNKRKKYWTSFQTVVYKFLRGMGDGDTQIPPSDLSQCVETITVCFIRNVVINDVDICHNLEDITMEKASWFDLILAIYSVSLSRYSREIIYNVQETLKIFLGQIPYLLLVQFISYIGQKQSFPSLDIENGVVSEEKKDLYSHQACTGMLLLTLHLQHLNSDVAPRLISEAVGTSVGVRNFLGTHGLVEVVLSALVRLSSCSCVTEYQSVIHSPIKRDTDDICFEDLKDFLRSSIYIGNDGIEMSDTSGCRHLLFFISSQINFVKESLMMMNRGNGEDLDECHVSRDYAFMWVHVSELLISMKTFNIDTDKAIKRVMMAISSLITVFWEYKSLRKPVILNLIGKICHGSRSQPHTSTDASIDNETFLYCLIISFITRSIVSIESRGKTNYCNKPCDSGDYRGENFASYLSPVCDMITNLDTAVPESIVLELTLSLSTVPTGRKLILSMAKTLVRTLSAFDKSLPYCSVRINRAVYGLCNLISNRYQGMKTHAKTQLDTFGLEALIILIDILTMDNSAQLTFKGRFFFIEKITIMIREGELSTWTLGRILNSTLFILLQYFQPTSENFDLVSKSCMKRRVIYSDLCFTPERNLRFQYPKLVNDIPGEELHTLICLILSLLQNPKLIYGEKDSSLQLSFELARNLKEVLLNIVVPKRTTPMRSDKSPLLNDPVDFSRNIALACIGSILVYITENKSSRNGISRGYTHKRYRRLHCSQLLKNLREQEMEQWSFEQLEGKTKRTVPSWIESKAPDELSSPFQCTECQKVICHAISSVCTVFLDFFLSSEDLSIARILSTIEKRALMRLSQGVNALVQSRQFFRSLSGGSILTDKEESTMTSLITNFFILSQKMFSFCVGDAQCPGNIDKVVEYMNLLLHSILNCCIMVKSLSTMKGCSGGERYKEMLHSLWGLYDAICSQKGSHQLVTFLELNSNLNCQASEITLQLSSSRELNSPDFGSSKQMNESYFQFLLQDIYSKDQMTAFVQHLRSIMMNCFAKIFRNAPQDDQNLYDRCIIDDFMFNLDVTLSLSCDILPGDGGSDDFSQPLHQIIVPLIEEGAKRIFDLGEFSFFQFLSEQRGYECLSKVKSQCQQITELFWNILCNFDLKQPALFKSSFRTCLCYLPHVITRIDRIYLYLRLISAHEAPPRDCSITTVGSSTSDTLSVLNQCISALLPIDDTKQLKHIEEAEGVIDEMSGENPASDYSCLQRLQIIECKPFTALQDRRRIRFLSETLRDWAYSCAISVLEQVWIDSNKYIQDKRKLSAAHPNDEVCNLQHAMIALQAYSKRRWSQLKLILSHINMLMSPLNHSSKDEENRSVAAQVLSLTTRQQLCGCLEKIALSLKHSFLFIKAHKKQDCVISSSHSMAIAESVACIYAWFCAIDKSIVIMVDSTSNNHIVDFSVGIRQWYSSEKKRISILTGSSRRSQFEDDPILESILKVLIRVEELEAVLVQFHHFCCENQKKNRNINRTTIMIQEIINGIAGASYQHGDQNTENGSIDLHQIVSSFIESLNESKLRVGSSSKEQTVEHSKLAAKNDGRPNSHENSVHKKLLEETNESYNVQPKKRKNCSSNGVVNDWLELDEKWSEIGETITSKNDAYTDLEDFIVEG